MTPATYPLTGYRAVVDFAVPPNDWTWTEVTAIALDSLDRLFVFSRSEHPVMIFDRDGRFVSSWGEQVFARPHGITIGPDDTVYCTDDLDHTVRRFTADGRLLSTLGTSGQPSATGATSVDYRTILNTGPPFHFPTNSALSPTGDLYVSDGYGNARIHRFSSEGQLISSWGEPGSGPGQFHVPHGIAVDVSGIVWVADRENSRLQRFSPDGQFISQVVDIARPCQIAFDCEENLYVAELGYRSGMWPGVERPAADAPGGRISVFDRQGELINRWGGGANPTAPGDFFAPHDIAIDSFGNVFVAEVVWSAGANRGHVSPDCHTLQKFERC